MFSKVKQVSLTGSILMIIAAAMIISAAVAFVPLNSSGFVLPKLICLAFAGVFGTWAALTHPDRDAISALLTTWTGRLLLLLIAITLLSPLWSIAPLLSIVGAPPRFEGVLASSIYFTLALTGIVAVQHRSSRETMLQAIVIANTAVVLYGILQAVGLDPLAGRWQSELFLGRVFSTIGQPTTLANFIILTLPFVVLTGLENVSWQRGLYWTLAALNLVVLLFTASRAAVLALLFSAVLWYMVMPQGPALPSLSGSKKLLIALLILLFGVIATWSFSSRFSVPTQRLLSFGSRGVIWNAALSMAYDRPTGYGPGTIGLISPRFLSPAIYEYESLTTSIDDVHSKPLQLLLTLGPLGLLLTCGFLLLLLLGLWQNRAADPLLPTIFIALAGINLSLLFGVEDPTTSGFGWLIAGMGLGSLPRPSLLNHPVFARRILQVTSGLALISAVFFIWWLTARVYAEKSDRLLRGNATREAVRIGARAVVIFPLDRQLLIESAESALLTLEQNPDVRATGQLHRLVGENMEQLSALTSRQDGMAPLLLGWQAAVRGDRVRASTLFTQAEQMRPGDMTVYRIAAHGYALLGDKERESAELQKLIGLLPDGWNDPMSARGRILRKEHPWLEQLPDLPPRRR